MSIINNVADLAVKHHEYHVARDVVRAMEKVCAELEFDLPNNVFAHIISIIGNNPPIRTARELEMLSFMVIEKDKQLSKKPQANDKRNE
jgi:hypothetical protein